MDNLQNVAQNIASGWVYVASAVLAIMMTTTLVAEWRNEGAEPAKDSSYASRVGVVAMALFLIGMSWVVGAHT